MKNTFIFLFLFLLFESAFSQLVPCRPKICMINYAYHIDTAINANMLAVQSALPDILVDNTPGGYWGQVNGGYGCIPSNYTPLGIQVFSYIAGGYEGHLYNNSIDNLTMNLSRIDLIAADSATGVFLDEVSSFPDSLRKVYITSIYNKCQSLGLKLILNLGVSMFDSWLMGKCDYILTDEDYDGVRQPTTYETPFLDRIIVVADSVYSNTTARNISLGARASGFGFSYACEEYISLPSWLTSYLTMITQPPITPIISLASNQLQSNATYGNQWFNASTGAISGATNKMYTPTTNGTYYSIVTLQGCSSDTSNKITYTVTSINEQSSIKPTLFPNPTGNYFKINLENSSKKGQIKIYDLLGKLIVEIKDYYSGNEIITSNFNDGIYLIQIEFEDDIQTLKLNIEK